MRIINLRLDPKLFRMMEKDKKELNSSSWESYIEEIFGMRRELKEYTN
jgi:hypothetical protein